MKRVLIVLLILMIFVGCQKQKTPDMNPPKGGYVEYYYDEGGEIYYGGELTTMLGPYNEPNKELEEKCNYFNVSVKDENGNEVRYISRDNVINQWNVGEYLENRGIKLTSYDGEMNFISADVNYWNEHNRVTKHLMLNEDNSVSATEIIVYLEDGITRYQVFMYNEEGELEWWQEYLPPLYNEFMERDVKEAPAEYITYR